MKFLKFTLYNEKLWWSWSFGSWAYIWLRNQKVASSIRNFPLFSGSAKFGSRVCYYGRGCYYDLIPTPRKAIEECQMPIIQ